MDNQQKTEIRDGMRIEWDVSIEMDDGLILRADVYRPIREGKYPVIMNHGTYGKWLHFEDAYTIQWRKMAAHHPEVTAGSTGKYQTWEAVDPEKWVPDDYVCIRVDSRGAGRSPGYLHPWSPRETKDFYNCIEWAAAQPWCTGKVGLCGISYYAMNQWQVAGLQPPHLTAMCAWEGGADFYRDISFHGGLFSAWPAFWYEHSARPRQHGLGSRGFRSRVTGEWVSGPETLTDEELAGNRCRFAEEFFSHPMEDDFWMVRSANWSKINVPFLSAGNWGGHGMHLRGNVEAFMRASSEEKWLEIHGLEHWTHFYTDYGLNLQKKFFGHFLKGEDTGWKDQPPVQLQIRHVGEKFIERDENEWPLARTQWTKLYFRPEGHRLASEPETSERVVSYQALGDGVTFLTEPFKEDTEITGPSAAKLFVSSETEDADLFLVVRVFSGDLKEVVFQGALDPHSPIAHGWLRASHRKLDPGLSLPYRPYHTHDDRQLLTPGEIYELDVEILPTCLVIPAGYRLGLSVRGKDYVYPGGGLSGPQSLGKIAYTGVGPYRHVDSRNRPLSVFGGRVSLYTGPERQAHILLPVIPKK
jgi:predicted acyl esterase